VTRGLTRVGGRLAGSAAGAFGAGGAAGARQDPAGTEVERVGSPRRAEVDGETGQDEQDDGTDTGTGSGTGTGDPRPLGGRPLTSIGGRDRANGRGPGRGTSGGERPLSEQGPSGRPPGSTGRDEEQLIAAELGPPGGVRRPPSSSSLERSSAGGRGPAGVAPGQGHGPSPRAPTRPVRRGVRRSEGADMADLDDLFAPSAPPREAPGPTGSSASSAGSEDLDGEEVFVVYRPDDPAGGGFGG
jgi:hypothetical protein